MRLHLARARYLATWAGVGASFGFLVATGPTGPLAGLAALAVFGTLLLANVYAWDEMTYLEAM